MALNPNATAEETLDFLRDWFCRAGAKEILIYKLDELYYLHGLEAENEKASEQIYDLQRDKDWLREALENLSSHVEALLETEVADTVQQVEVRDFSVGRLESLLHEAQQTLKKTST